MEKVTTILNDNIDKQTLKSIDKLVDAFDTTTNDTMDDDNDDSNKSLPMSSKPTINANVGIYAGEGENKVIVSKKSKRKQKHGYRMKAIVTATSAAKQSAHSTTTTTTTTITAGTEQSTHKRIKARPKYFCSF